MILFAHCRSCDTKWRVVKPDTLPMDLQQAIAIMEAGLCPTCGNDGTRGGPVNWKFTLGGDAEPTYAQIRKRRA